MRNLQDVYEKLKEAFARKAKLDVVKGKAGRMQLADSNAAGYRAVLSFKLTNQEQRANIESSLELMRIHCNGTKLDYKHDYCLKNRETGEEISTGLSVILIEALGNKEQEQGLINALVKMTTALEHSY